MDCWPLLSPHLSVYRWWYTHTAAGYCVSLRETEQQGETLRTLPKDKSQGSNSSVESELTLWDVASSRRHWRLNFCIPHSEPE